MNLDNDKIELYAEQCILPYHDGDGLLWWSIRYYALKKLGVKQYRFDLEKELDKFIVNGEVFRNIDHSKVKNTSRDMICGLLLAMTVMENPTKYLKEIYEYWKANNWTIGGNGPYDDRNKATWNIRYLLGRLFEKHNMYIPWDLKVPSALWLPVDVGYPQHLKAIQYLIMKECGEAGLLHTFMMKVQYFQDPLNALFAYLAGDCESACSLLNKFPTYRIPTIQDDYFTPYLWQRNSIKSPDDFLPEPHSHKQHEHNGIDYLLVAALLSNKTN